MRQAAARMENLGVDTWAYQIGGKWWVANRKREEQMTQRLMRKWGHRPCEEELGRLMWLEWGVL